MAVITSYLTPSGWMRLGARRDAAAIRYLTLHPGREAAHVAYALGRSVHATHKRLRRLEREGRVYSRLECDEVFFYHAYYASPQIGEVDEPPA